MARVKYRFNPENLTFEKVALKGKNKVKRILFTSLLFLSLGLIINFFIQHYIGQLPELIKLKKENNILLAKLNLVSINIEEFKNNLVEIQQRDDNLYRPIFEIEPISESIRKAGFGGTYRYDNLEGYAHSEQLIGLTQKTDELIKQIYVQSKSYDQVIEKAVEKDLFFKSRPGIKPVSDNDYIRISDYFGWRRDPFTKKASQHHGVDFAGPEGGKIHATGKGVVVEARYTFGGYGKIVIIDHGFGFKTKYAHLKKINVKIGQKVERGQTIGLMGNTGRSTGSHLHYEVLMNNKPVNPLYFFNEDISPEEYAMMVKTYSIQ